MNDIDRLSRGNGAEPGGLAASTIHQPAVAAGSIIRRNGPDTVEVTSLATGAVVEMPSLTDSLVTSITGGDRTALAGVALQDIIGLIDRVGRAWRNPEYTRRQIYTRQLRQYLGYSERMAETEADWISVVLTSHARFYDMVQVEIGSRYILDEWVPREETRVRAFPRGVSVHILPGNVPVAAALSLTRGLITKNRCVLKASSLDPITPVALAMSFHDVEPDHPVTSAISALYWEHDHPLGLNLLADADVVCAWGGAAAIASAQRNLRPGVPLVAFGPRRSLALVGASDDLDQAVARLAHDVARYDQAACFSVREVFVERPVAQQVADGLGAALAELDLLLPPAVRDLDDASAVTLALLEEEWDGADLRLPDHRRWAVIVGDRRGAEEHPLHRVIWVRPVDRLADALDGIDPSVQTVAISPWSRAEGLRDQLAAAGVDRIVEVGLVNVLRPGAPHDGQDPLRALVRLAGVENPASAHGKGMPVEIDQLAALRRGRITDFLL